MPKNLAEMDVTEVEYHSAVLVSGQIFKIAAIVVNKVTRTSNKRREEKKRIEADVILSVSRTLLFVVRSAHILCTMR